MSKPDEIGEELVEEGIQAQADLRYLIRRFIRFAEEQARAAGITPQQHMLLLAIRGHPSYPAVTIKDIAQRLQLRHHSTSLLIDRGVRRGLLVRKEDPSDRRRVLVSLTSEGGRLLAFITQANWRELQAFDEQLLDVHRSLVRAFGDSTTGPVGTSLRPVAEPVVQSKRGVSLT